MTSNNQSSFATILKYCETLKNVITSLASTFLTNESNKFYIRIAIMLSTFVAFITGCVTTTMLNHFYFLNNLVNTIKHLTMSTKTTSTEQNEDKLREQDQIQLNKSISVLNSWVTFSSIMIFFNLLNCFSRLFNMTLVTFLCECVKCYTYYKLISDFTVSETANKKITVIYTNNKAGIDNIQSIGIEAVSIANDTFSEESKNDLINAAISLKTVIMSNYKEKQT